MRYIPDTGKQFVLQVPEDKNSYINIKNLGAKGVSTVFSGRVIAGLETGLSIGDITDGGEGTLQQYLPILSPGTELRTYIYRPAGTLVDSPVITVIGQSFVGVDYTNTNIGSGSSFLKELKYYIFGYDLLKGIIPNAVQIVGGNGLYTKVLDPDLWNQDQYAEIQFSRVNTSTFPIIYRVWGNKIKFLGIIGNNKIGYPGAGTVSFRDYGIQEIPSWNNDEDNWTPEFLDGVFSITGGVPTIVNKMVGTEDLKILPRVEGAQLNYLQCETVSGQSLINPNSYTISTDTVKFVVDDTKSIREAISLAGSGNIKEIFFPAGTYRMRDSSFDTLQGSNYDNITFRGVGEGSIIERMWSTKTSALSPGLLNFKGTSDAPVQGLRFRSLVFSGNVASNVSINPPSGSSIDPSRYITETLVHLSYVSNPAFSECRFIYAGSPGIHIEDTSAAIINNCVFSNLGRSYETSVRPLEIYTTDSSIIQGNIFQFCTASPFFSRIEYSTINNNIVRSCGDEGIVLESSDKWNAGDNLSYSDSGSLIQSIDQYNNEYSKAGIEIKKGSSLEPIFFTVTNGGESVAIKQDSIEAEIWELDSNYRKAAAGPFSKFRVLQTADQLEAGIFSVTLPGKDGDEVNGIKATNEFAYFEPNATPAKYGYMYDIKATVRLGNSGRGYTPVNIRRTQDDKFAITLKNSSEILSFQIFNERNTQNDSFVITEFNNTEPELSGLIKGAPYTISGIDIESNSIIIESIPGVTVDTDGINFQGGRVFIQRPFYDIADGNIYVN